MTKQTPIASDKSWEVMQKIRAEREGREVPKVKAPVQKSARFDAYAVVASNSSPVTVVW